jgi:hypothetical protein
MTFRVGQKVVCVDANFYGFEGFGRHKYPTRGTVYHIREIVDACGEANVRLAEIKNGIGVCISSGKEAEPFFRASRFRPIVERKDEISFTEGAPKDSEQFDNRRKIGVDA